MQSPQSPIPPHIPSTAAIDLMRYLSIPCDMDSIFSSPATDVDDPTINASKFTLHPPEPLTPIAPLTAKPSVTPPTTASNLDSFLGPLYDPSLISPVTASLLTVSPTAKPDAHIIPLTVPPQPHPPPHLHNAFNAHNIHLTPAVLSPPTPPPPHQQTSPSTCHSPRVSHHQSHPLRPLKRKRSLSTLRSAALHNAPNVALSDAELCAIGDMHESELQLAQSKNVYFALQQFNHVLSRHQYRIKSIHLEPLANDAPFDFIVAKTPTPPTKEQTADSSNTPETAHASEHHPRPAKRARHSTKVDSSSSATRLSCVVCRKSMADLETLVRHFRHTHQDLKPYSCPRCGGFYASENTLWTHISNVHTETPRKYKCSYCDASYDSFGAKTRHEHATHTTSNLPYTCSYEGCNLEFKFPAHLETHAARAHPGFRPFACNAESCSKSFPSLNGLTRHRREVHDRVLVYRCSCGKTHPKRCHLKRHLLNVHKMSPERVKQEMKKQPHPGLLHIVPPGPPAACD
ncbi:hypothetical protein BWQ96_01550 [Gracilariopsis chorda]|uniref:C2H2-type domain-containing protein n=1 Tax=Gracilariopsis chorda TaxID=448386 RepID=A0A2V3J2R2_9FLOR|nr:hypothetical protein BWQ96_01550 [Gracilariopsis chorda]|eukprot:PXF48698.1 hypothetical protein BWQ96_01550 [Gracilariopsis chorda]